MNKQQVLLLFIVLIGLRIETNGYILCCPVAVCPQYNPHPCYPKEEETPQVPKKTCVKYKDSTCCVENRKLFCLNPDYEEETDIQPALPITKKTTTPTTTRTTTTTTTTKKTTTTEPTTTTELTTEIIIEIPTEPHFSVEEEDEDDEYDEEYNESEEDVVLETTTIKTTTTTDEAIVQSISKKNFFSIFG